MSAVLLLVGGCVGGPQPEPPTQGPGADGGAAYADAGPAPGADAGGVWDGGVVPEDAGPVPPPVGPVLPPPPRHWRPRLPDPPPWLGEQVRAGGEAPDAGGD